MQVTLSTTQSNSIAEPAANSAEPPESGSASAFFAQMDQIWNRQDEPDASADKKTDEQTSTMAGNDPLTLMVGASLKIRVPQQVVPTANPPGSDETTHPELAINLQVAQAPMPPVVQENAPLNASGGPDSSIDHAVKDAGINYAVREDGPVKSMPDPVAVCASADVVCNSTLNVEPVLKEPDREFASKRKSNGEQVQSEFSPMPCAPIGKMLDVPDAVPAAKPDSDVDSIDDRLRAGNPSAEKVQIDLVSGRQTGSNFRTPDVDTERSQPHSFFKSEVSTSWKISEAEQFGSGRELIQGSADMSRFSKIVPESGQESIPLSNSSSTAIPGFPGDLKPSESSDKQTDTIKITIPANSETVAPPVLENAGTGDSRANQDQDNSRNNSGLWTSLQTRPGSSQMDPVKSRTTFFEGKQEVSSQMVSNPARLTVADAPSMPAQLETSSSQPKEFILQLADRIQVQLRDGKGEIRIQLQPDSLGHLEIRAESTVNGVVARIVAESDSVKNYLETNLHLLQQSLHDQGLKIDRIQVSVQDNSGFESFSGHTAQFGRSGSGRQESGNDRSSGISGFPNADQREELTVDPLTWISLNPNTRFHTVA